MAKGTETQPKKKTEESVTPFRRMLVVIDESPSAEAAVGLVVEWVDGPGADVRFVQVAEERKRRRSSVEPGAGPLAVESAHHLVIGAPTLGGRNRQLVHGIAAAARDFGADVIVLGFDRRRLAGHRLAASLREQVMRATDVPVLVAASPHPGGKRHRRLVPDLHRDGERADDSHRYVRV